MIEKFKVPSTIRQLTGINAHEGISMEGKTYAFGPDVVEYQGELGDLQDLITYYPLAVKWLEKQGWDTRKISVSLPAGTYRQQEVLQRQKIDNMLDRLIGRLRSVAGVEEVVVMPQGVAAFYHIINEDPALFEHGNVLNIDGGFNTVNVSMVAKEESGYRAIYTKTYYDEFGVRDLLQRFFLAELQGKYPEATSNNQRLNKAFIKGKVDGGVRAFDVTMEKNRAIEAFMQTAFPKILQDVRKADLDFGAFSIVGGLSHYLNDNSFDTDKRFLLPKDDGEFYTAIGMAKANQGIPAVDFGFGHLKVAIYRN